MQTFDKPAGIPVFPPHRDPTGNCVLALLLAAEPWRKKCLWPPGFEGGIAHRLDTSTSGALVIADSIEELGEIRLRFTQGALTKRYMLRTARTPSWNTNQIDLPLAHHKTKKGRVIVKRGNNTPHRGKWYAASTTFARIDHDIFSATMRSGFMHQIRAHAGFLGIPILGDRHYGGGQAPPETKSGITFFLHHCGLSGEHGFQTTPVPLPTWASATKN